MGSKTTDLLEEDESQEKDTETMDISSVGNSTDSTPSWGRIKQRGLQTLREDVVNGSAGPEAIGYLVGAAALGFGAQAVIGLLPISVAGPFLAAALGTSVLGKDDYVASGLGGAGLGVLLTLVTSFGSVLLGLGVPLLVGGIIGGAFGVAGTYVGNELSDRLK